MKSGYMLRLASLLGITLAITSQVAWADHCYRTNPAGGRIPVDCVHPERDKLVAPGLGKSNLPGINQGEIDMINKLLDGAGKSAVKPAKPAVKPQIQVSPKN